MMFLLILGLVAFLGVALHDFIEERIGERIAALHQIATVAFMNCS